MEGLLTAYPFPPPLPQRFGRERPVYPNPVFPTAAGPSVHLLFPHLSCRFSRPDFVSLRFAGITELPRHSVFPMFRGS